MSFWGLVVEPNKLYSQTVPCTYKVTMAVLEDDAASSDKESSKTLKTSVVLVVNKNEFKVCKLTSGLHEQQTLDLVLQAGAEVDFKVVGEKPATVYLTGYYLEDEEDDEDNDICSEEEADDEMADFIDDEAVEDDEINEESEAEFTDEDDEEEIDSETGGPRIQEMGSDEEEDDEDDLSDEDDEEEISISKSGNNNKRAKPEKENIDTNKNVKRVKTEEQKPVQKPSQPTPEVSRATSPEKKKSSEESKRPSIQVEASNKQSVKEALPKDLKVEDVKLGEGAKAKKGRKIGITYKGMLPNGKVFDESKGNDILYFTVGKGEVIQGMDLGVQDMTLGGTRRLTIPPALGYGDKSQAKIPANSTLIFEIKLVKVDTKKN
jgi:FK506-binding nuclear protein